MIKINQAFKHSFSFTQDEVNRFAEVTGDKNPIHLDAEFAAKTLFKKPIVHGMLGASMFSKVMGTLFPGDGTIYLKQSLIFMRPMYVNTQYYALFTVKEIDIEKHRATIETQIIDATTNKVCTTGEANIMNKVLVGGLVESV